MAARPLSGLHFHTREKKVEKQKKRPLGLQIDQTFFFHTFKIFLDILAYISECLAGESVEIADLETVVIPESCLQLWNYYSFQICNF